MVQYFDRHGAKQNIHGKPYICCCLLCVIANPVEYDIQFILHAGKDSQLNDHEDIELGWCSRLLESKVSAHVINLRSKK